jgi:hypothetical protein
MADAPLQTAAPRQSLQRRPKHLEIDQRFHTLKIVALGRQFRQPFVDIKKPKRSPLRRAQVNQLKADMASGFWRRPAVVFSNGVT